MPPRLAFRRRSGGAPAGDHAYFESLIARSDLFKAVSLRPDPLDSVSTSPYWKDQLTKPTGYYETAVDPFEPTCFTYSPGTDTDPAAQDACKHIIPPYIRVNSNVLLSDCPSASSGDSTVLACTNVSTTYQINRHMKLDDEVMLISARDTTLDTITVTRGQQGTTAVAHTAGTPTKVCSNTTPGTIKITFNTADELTRFFFTWDAYFTTSYLLTGLTNHKAWQMSSGGSQIWLEPNNTYLPSEPEVGDWINGVDVAAFQTRSYSGQMPNGYTDEPAGPMLNTFTIKPNTWIRYFYLIDIRSREDDANYFDVGMTLNGDIADGSVTSFSLAMGVSTAGGVGQTVQHAYIKIDSEILRFTTTVNTASPRTVTVARGCYGTSAVFHASGAVVRALCHARLSIWIGDATRSPLSICSDIPVSLHGVAGGGAGESSISDFEYEWNTSTTAHVARSTRDLVGYHRNWVALKSATLDPVAEGIVVSP